MAKGLLFNQTSGVQSINNIIPDKFGNINLDASDVKALPTNGGKMTGPIQMQSNRITGVSDPVDNLDATNLESIRKESIGISNGIISDALLVHLGDAYAEINKPCVVMAGRTSQMPDENLLAGIRYVHFPSEDSTLVIEIVGVTNDYTPVVYYNTLRNNPLIWTGWVKAGSLNSMLASGPMVLSENQYGDNLPSAGIKGRIFFKKVK